MQLKQGIDKGTEAVVEYIRSRRSLWRARKRSPRLPPYRLLIESLGN